MPKKLYFIKKRWSPYGGAEKYMKMVAGRLADKYEIHILSGSWSQYSKFILHKVPVINLGSFASTLSFDKNSAALLKSLPKGCIVSFERTRYQDIYRAGDGCHAEWIEIRELFEPSYKNISIRFNPLHQLLLKLENDFFKKTPLIVANSTMVKDNIQKHYQVPDEHIKVIYNGVDTSMFNPLRDMQSKNSLRAAFDSTPDDKVIIFVGSGFHRKGLKLLIEAIRILDNHQLKIWVVGQGEIKLFRKLAAESKVADKISFLGPQKDMAPLYGAADLFVLPTLYDPFSNATIEAMASGLGIITTKNNGAAELINEGIEGFVTEDLFNAEELAGKIGLAINKTGEMGRQARIKAEQHTIELSIKSFSEIIELCTDMK